MARKVQDTITPPQVDRPTAIALLVTQFEAARKLLERRPLGDQDFERWGLVTKTQLEKAFGRGSPVVWTVVDAGVRSVCPIDADAKWWEAYRADRLAGQARELAIALNRLGVEPKIAVPPPPRAERQQRSRRGDPDHVGRAAHPTASSVPTSGTTPAAAETPLDADLRRPPDLLETSTRPPLHDGLLASVAEDMCAGWNSGPSTSPRRDAAPAEGDVACGDFTGVACSNGHAITSAAEAYPRRATPHCRDCGAATLRSCRECGVAIRGAPSSDRLDDRAEPRWSPPNYCHSCGAPHPWTRLRREAVEGMIGELHEVEDQEREGLLAVVPDTINVTPKTAVAVLRWKRILAKLATPTRVLVADLLRQSAAPFLAQHLDLTS